MRFIYLIILVLLLAAVVVFAVQNNETVTLRFLNSSVSSSMPLVIAAVYLLGMLSGWTVIGFLRYSFRRVARRPEKQ
jgi:putative membrane protein